jgi:hypothetical protein
MEKEYLESLVEQGLSTNQIASQLNKGQTTIIYWLKKYDLKTKHKSFKNISPEEKINKNNQYCEICKVKLNDKNAYLRKEKNRNVFHGHCKECFSKNLFEKRFNFKKKALEYKGDCCESCGYNKDITALEFHHKNPAQKEINPAKLYHKPWDFAKEELDKCSVLCSNCHREEHHSLYQVEKMKTEFDLFNEINFSKSILTGKNTKEKSCNVCDIILNSSNKVKGRNRYICKSCDSKRMITRQQNRKKEAVDYMGGKCSLCGYNKCIRALEFHHTDSTQKSKDYNENFDKWNMQRKKQELENCIIVCSNCHREIHSKDDHKINDTI